MSRVRHSSLDCGPGCPVEGTLQVIGGKWKGVILYHLLDGPVRFNQLRRLLQTCTQRMLTNQLRELEADGLVDRHIYAQVPPKVEYSLTPRGRTLEPVILALKAWGDAYAVTAASPAA
jgi:DNA-binding HxlR family transcriptional regulator